MDYNELALTLHKQYKGKITTKLRDESELDASTDTSTEPPS